MNLWRPWACFAVAVLVACGGGGGNSSVPAVGIATPPATAGPSVPVSFKIKVSGTGSSATVRKPAFVSPNTQSVSIAAAIAPATPATIATVNLSGSNCTTDNTGTTCTITAPAPTGQVTFTIVCWSGTSGTGNQLSTATVLQTVAANANNAISFTLNGVVASTGVILGSTSVLVGTPATIAVTVLGYDASGAIIIGPGNYSSPITLADSDTSGATALSTTNVTAPGTNVTLSYSGGTLGGATITPSINSTNGTAQTFAPTGLAYAVYTLPAISDYDVIAAGPDGNTWFAGYGAIGSISNGGLATTYTDVNNGVPDSEIYALTSAGGAMWFGDNSGDLGSITTGGTVTLVSSVLVSGGSCGNGPYSEAAARRGAQGVRRALTGQPTCANQNGYPIGWMVTGPDGNVWFSDEYGLIGSIVPGSNTATEWPISQFTGGNSSPNMIAFGPDGALYVADYAGYIERVTVSGGTVTGVTQLPVTFGCGPYDLGIGPDGVAWFADGCSSLGAIPTGSGFTAANMQNWSIATITNNNYANFLLGSPGGVWLSTFPNNGNSNNALYRITNAGTAASPAPVIASVNPFTSSNANIETIGLGINNNLWAVNACPYPNTIAKILYGAPQTGSLSAVRAKAGTRSRPAAGIRRHPRQVQQQSCGNYSSPPPTSEPSGEP